MKTKKYKLTDETIDYRGRTLHRIMAIRNFSDVRIGDLGGYIEEKSNLNQYGDCWVYDDAKVYGKAKVYDNAKIRGNASVYNKAEVYDHAEVFDNAIILSDNSIATVCGKSRIYGNALIKSARICGNSKVYDNACVSGGTTVYNAEIFGHAVIYKRSRIFGLVPECNMCTYDVCNDDKIIGIQICGKVNMQNIFIYGDAKIEKDSDYFHIETTGSKSDEMTAYKDSYGHIIILRNNTIYSLNGFEKYIKKYDNDKDNKKYKKYLILTSLIKSYFDIDE